MHLTKSHLTFPLYLIILCLACQNNQTSEKNVTNLSFTKKIAHQFKTIDTFDTFDRNSCIDRVKKKISNQEPLVIHMMVPLCDNDNQGIVKVNAKLGDGQNLRTNLYWGSKYGIKNFFHKLSPWKLLESQKNIDNNILERIILYREYANQTKAYLIADAYAGDKMKNCLSDYFNAISGNSKEQININDNSILIKSNADLLIFNGHNGLMDYEMEFVNNQDDKIREAAVIGCVSHSYFLDHFKHAKAYPVLMTSNLMAPEAYVSDALIDSWITQHSNSQNFKTEVGKAYHKYQKCGIKGATRLFKTGWE